MSIYLLSLGHTLGSTAIRFVSSKSSVLDMAFGLYTLFEAALLVLNGFAVLNEERFLSKIGGRDQLRGFGEEPGAKQQLISLIRSVRTVMRIPLIFLNILTILFKLILG